MTSYTSLRSLITALLPQGGAVHGQIRTGLVQLAHSAVQGGPGDDLQVGSFPAVEEILFKRK